MGSRQIHSKAVWVPCWENFHRIFKFSKYLVDLECVSQKYTMRDLMEYAFEASQLRQGRLATEEMKTTADAAPTEDSMNTI